MIDPILDKKYSTQCHRLQPFDNQEMTSVVTNESHYIHQVILTNKLINTTCVLKLNMRYCQGSGTQKLLRIQFCQPTRVNKKLHLKYL